MSVAGVDCPCQLRLTMDSMETLMGYLKDEYSSLGWQGLREHFKTRENPKYLFTIEDAEAFRGDGILDDAEKTMRHDIFGHKFQGDIDYSFNPTTETSRDNEWSWSLFRTIYWQPLIRAYAITKDERYAKEFISEMKGFIKAWPAEEHIKNTTFEIKTPFPGHAWRTIETGIRIYTTWLPAFEVFRHSPFWDGDDFAVFLLSIRDHARFLMGHYSNHDRSSNWLSMEATALYQIGVMFPEFKEAKEWMDTGYERIAHEVMYCFSPSGVHMEKTPIYHLVATISFMQAIVLSEKNGIPTPPYGKEIITRAARYVTSLLKPDLSTPMIGDADRDDLTTRKADESIYEGMNLSFFPDELNELRAFLKFMSQWTGGEDFLFFSSLRKEGKEPKALDYAYANEGIFVMRSGWGRDDDYALMHSVVLERGERSTHSHDDSGTVEVSLLGDDVLSDSGRYIYRSSIWKDWRAYFCSALAHNTLYVDGHEMGTVPGVDRVRGVRVLCHRFGETDGVRTADISHNGYAFIPDPIFHRRKLMLFPEHFAVIIDCVTGRGMDEHDFALSLNYAKGELEGMTFISPRGKKFETAFESDAPFECSHYFGSEDPKGGWISYGYPVREKRHQLRFRYHGKAPFKAMTMIKPEGLDVSYSFKDGILLLETGKKRYRITEEGLEATWK